MGEIERLGKYQIHSVLGQGAMGVVYQGYDPVIGRTVALKTIRKGVFAANELGPLLSRLKHEAQAAGRLTHPGIVTVYDYGEEGETAFIAMEYVQGRELAEVLEKGERLGLATAIEIFSQLLDVLAYSHAHGVVHRDIKPGNILLLADGRIKVTDFGIAKIEASDLTQCGDVLGTPSYMSPEQYEGLPVDRRSDLFSAGVILYHLLTGEKPFPGNSLATIMHRVLHTIPARVSELNGQLPASLDPVIAKALAKKADDRYQSAEEFAAALAQARPGHDKAHPAEAAGPASARNQDVEATVAMKATELRPEPASTSAGPANRLAGVAVPRRWQVLAAGLVLLALAAGGAIWLFGHPAAPRRDAAPAPTATGTPAGPGERTASPVTVPAQPAQPAQPAPAATTSHRRAAARTATGQAPSATGGISRPAAKATRASQPAPATKPPLASPREPQPTVTPANPATAPTEATRPSPGTAIKGPSGLGRKLREDEW